MDSDRFAIRGGGLRPRLPLAILMLAALLPLACQTTPSGELVPFSETLRLRYRLAEPELRSLQYYLSDRIVIERSASGGLRRVDRGRLIVRSGSTIQQVVIESGTPGAIEPAGRVGPTATGSYALAISFERGAPLEFVARSAEGTYSLAAPTRSGFLAEFFAGWGRLRHFDVDFDGTKWTVVAGSDARLLIERNALGKITRSRRTLPGVRAPR